MPNYNSVGGNDKCFFEPRVLHSIPEKSPAGCEELFGPVFSLFRVESEEEAINLANASDYGLGAAVFSRDLERAQTVAKQLDAGMLYVNDFVQS